jgi:hypothetical protein
MKEKGKIKTQLNPPHHSYNTREKKQKMDKIRFLKRQNRK